ncbi:hypothetical protein P280DRAFT_464822 [Massarina eburnea CBS 473.64]|uniref:Uncharacterized protein n=1 Tax=Massarina eburnea CBS 473.64 TaxID=1395130 RepID=A0A6A6SFR9_9PLEO|nr:hypothetical protein P280DRAFT_464822 [Massarina eburnea CBS 473.64]
MTLPPNANSSPTGTAIRNFGRPATHDPTTMSKCSSTSLGKRPVQPNEPVYTKPFDQRRPLGGGAEKDIFRYFKIFPAEEAAFLTSFATKRPMNAYISHDDGGTLIFRISSANLSELAVMGISGTNCAVPDPDAQWLQVCDREGVSWLTQFRYTDFTNVPSELYDTTGNLMTTMGRIGQYGPSGLSVSDYVKRQSQRGGLE